MSEIPEWGCNGIACQMYDDCMAGECEMKRVWDKSASIERERCAKISEGPFTRENVLKTTKGEPYITSGAAIYAATVIAAAIRKQ